MVQTPIRPGTRKKAKDIDSEVREYIQGLCKGVWPDDQPEDFGEWKDVIEDIERIFTKTQQATKSNAQKIAEQINKTITGLCKTDPALAELLNPPPTLDDIEIENEDISSFVELPEYAQLAPSLAEGACPWLDKYVRFSRMASPEAYDDYHVFTGLWALSVVNARRAYLPLGNERVYGNLMIALYGNSSLFAKSTTARVAKKMLIESGLGHLLGPDKPSPSKLLSNMAGKHIASDYSSLPIEKQELIRKKMTMPGQKGMYIDEIGKFIESALKKNSTNSEFVDILLTLDACPLSLLQIPRQGDQSRSYNPISPYWEG
ncbi:hypothetical protein [Dictyobacter kobayashii]|nr:hypothetical protein [Dictyobacter kobayashii]